MSSRELDNLVKSGLLKREEADQKEITGLVDSGRKRLADAQKGGLSDEGRFDLAYNAAHAFALAAMRRLGYRPAKRYIVFQALEHTLDLKPEVWRIFDKCHGNRNILEYDGIFDVDRQLLTDLVDSTKILEKALISALAVSRK